MSVTSGIATTVPAGTYTVTETSDSGYTATFSGDCNASGVVTLAAGQNKTCTITNNDNPTPYVPVAGNLIANPSFESGPTGWTANEFDVVADHTVPTGGSHSGDRHGKVEITVDNGGDAKWVFASVPVTPGQYYTYSNWYKSNVPTEVDIFYTTADGEQIELLNQLPVASDWTKFETGFLVPNGATHVTIAHIVDSIGILQTDDYALVLGTPGPVFDQGIVSLTFDDGWKSIYTNAIPVLDAANLNSTQYIHTDPVILNPSNYAVGTYMTVSDLVAMQAAGHDISAHTRTHSDLTLGSTNLTSEIDGSKSDLMGATFSPVDSLAYPYGAYSPVVQAAVQSAGFEGARSVDEGYNFTDTDRYALKIQHITNLTTFNDVKDWIDTAIQNKVWLILMFHEVVPTVDSLNCKGGGGTDLTECSSVTLLQQVADYLVANNVSVPTVSQGLVAMETGEAPDTIRPTIALTGDNPQIIEAGDSYTELGATASDNKDGNLTSSIVIDASAVNTDVPGSYTVTYNVSDEAGNQAIEKTRTVTVVARAITITAQNIEKTFGDGEPELTYQVTAGSLINSGDVTGALTREAGDSVGVYAITQGTLTVPAQYALTFVPGTFTIGKADTATVITCDPSSVAYNGEPQEICSATVTGQGGLSQAVAVTYENNTNAGTATASAVYEGSTNYNGSTGTETFVIEKAEVVITATASDKGYDGTDAATVSLEVTGESGGDDLTATGIAHFDDKNAGEDKVVTVTDIILSGANSENYSFTGPVTANADIAPILLSVTVLAEDKVYDGTVDASVTFLTDKLDGDSADVTGDASFDSKDVGNDKTVTVTNVEISGSDAENYHLAGTGFTVSADITVLETAVSAAAEDKTYDGTTAATVTLAVDELVASDDVSATYTAADFDDANVGAGKIVTVSGITLTGTDALNYSLTSVTATANADITAESSAIEITDLEFIYDGNPKEVVVTTDPGELAYTVEYEGGTAPTDAGEYDITVTITDPNYAGTKTAVLTINPIVITVTAEDAVKAFGAEDPTLAYAADLELIAGNEFSGTLAREAGEAIGSYVIEQGTLDIASGNYAITFVPGTFTIAVDPNNLPPVIQIEPSSPVSVNQNSSVDITIIATDPEGVPVDIEIHAPEFGSLNDTGDFTHTSRYTPNDGFYGQDSFIVIVNDGNSSTQTSVNITVNLLPICETGTLIGGECVQDPFEGCPAGYALSTEGDEPICVADEATPTSAFSCPNETDWVLEGEMCISTIIETEEPTVCEEGYHLDGGQCLSDVDDTPGNAPTCENGELNGENLCVFPPDEIPATENLSCPAGYNVEGNDCVAEVETTTPSCPEGTMDIGNGMCQPDAIPMVCPVSGFHVEGSICVADVIYTVSASAGSNGTISPAGEIEVVEGGSQSFTISANSGYRIADVIVDGASVGTVTNYEFSGISANHTIAASFVAEQTASSGNGGGGGGGGRRSTRSTPAPSVTAASTTIGQVLGATTGPNQFIFLIDLTIGSTGNDVLELQKRLTAEGVYNGPITGYFGTLTQAAVKAYQEKNGIAPVSGYVGPITRAELNGSQANSDLQAFIQLLISLGVISPDKMAEALKAAGI